jgi:hypothetical protein
MITASRARKARRAGRCPLCRGPVLIGQRIARLGLSWVHARCAIARIRWAPKCKGHTQAEHKKSKGATRGCGESPLPGHAVRQREGAFSLASRQHSAPTEQFADAEGAQLDRCRFTLRGLPGFCRIADGKSSL